MKRLSIHQILFLHAQLLAATGGANGIRDEGLLESALEAPFAGFAGEQLYPSVEAKAARLAFGLTNNHPFVDGNKRIGVLAMLVTLRGNGIAVRTTDEDLIQLGIALAAGEMDTKAVTDWISQHVIPGGVEPDQSMHGSFLE